MKKFSRNALLSGGFGLSYLPPPRIHSTDIGPGKPKTPRALAKRFMAYRAAKQAAEDPPVDLFCRRGESSTRFAYFD